MLRKLTGTGTVYRRLRSQQCPSSSRGWSKDLRTYFTKASGHQEAPLRHCISAEAVATLPARHTGPLQGQLRWLYPDEEELALVI